MITLLKDLDCFCPKHVGKKDILIVENKIHRIADFIETNDLIENRISCSGLLAFPGIIDQHVHIIGGGGESGFESRIPEIEFRDIILSGESTIVGLLGADDQTKGLKSLLAKARALENQGLTTFIYSGSYAIPPVTLTGNLTSDMVLIDKVIGAGEIAISDHRSSHPNVNAILSIAAQTHMGGLISNKAGVVHIHVGDGKSGLSLLFDLLKTSDLPIEMFIPTHNNRNTKLFQQALEYYSLGGNVDLTAGETSGLSVPEAIKKFIDKGFDLKRVTVSSDADGNLGDGKVGNNQTLFDDVFDTIRRNHFRPELVIPVVTENVAKVLKLYPRKGALREGSDADILITDKQYHIQKLFSRGRLIFDKEKR